MNIGKLIENRPSSDIITVGIDQPVGIGRGIGRGADAGDQPTGDGNPAAREFAAVVVDRRDEPRIVNQEVSHRRQWR